jgi:hypothetical protein
MSAPDEEHGAATKLQAIQRGRNARANSKGVDDDGAIPEVAEWPPYCDPEYVMPEQFEVMGNDDVLMISVTKFKGPKPYYGGYRHRKTGRIYHHAGTQSDKRGLIPEPRDVDRLKHRDTQTYEVKTRSVQLSREYGTQMERQDVMLDNSTDYDIEPRRYFSATQQLELKRQKTLVIQCYWRGYVARKRTWGIRQSLFEKQQREEMAASNMAQKKEKQRKFEVERRINPRTVRDFELLYNELETWRQRETTRLERATDLTADEKRAELTEVLAKETKALQTIDRLKVAASKEGRAKRTARMMELMAMPKEWELGDGELQSVHTPFTTRARELMELYNGLATPLLAVDERLDVLLNVKWTVQEFDCPLTRDIVELCDREADLLNRGRSATSVDGLRKRILNLFLQFIETPDFNPESTRFLKVRRPCADLSTPS